MKSFEKGFALVQTLMIVGILVIIGAAAYYVYKANNDVDKTLSSGNTQQASITNKKAVTKNPEIAPDPTADWVKYVDPSGAYEFKHPKNWVTKTCDEIFMLAPNEGALGVCNSDSASQMSAYTFTVESGPMGLQKDQYNNFKEQNLKISGLDATKQSGVYKESGFVGPQAGDSVLEYRFKGGDTYYVFSYVDIAQRKFTDVKSEFETILEKTLTIK